MLGVTLLAVTMLAVTLLSVTILASETTRNGPRGGKV